MEIKIRTHDEFQRDHVTIEISGTAEEATVVSGRLARGRQAGYWAEACERAEQEVRELKEARAGDAGTIEGLREQVAELGQQLFTSQQAREIETKRADGLALTVQGYDLDRHTERDRADRAEADLKDLKARTVVAADELARYRRAHVCTDRCTKDAHVAFEGRQLVTELEAELAEVSAEVRRLKEELNRRFTTAQVEDAKAGAREDARAECVRQHGVTSPLQRKLDEIGRAVMGTELKNEITTYRDSSAAMLMVEALMEVRRLTGITSV
jgi:uncharacterized coiled-coil DUF342 family protein